MDLAQFHQFIEQFNEGWTQGKFDQVSDLLHDDVVFMAPDLKNKVQGKDQCLGTITEYAKNVTTTSFRVLDQIVEVWKDASVITIEYLVEYQMQNQTYKEKGTEVWTLIKQGQQWQMVWRALIKSETPG